MNQNLKNRFTESTSFPPLVAVVIAVSASLTTLGIQQIINRAKPLTKQEFREMVEEVVLGDGPMSQAQAKALIKKKKRSR